METGGAPTVVAERRLEREYAEVQTAIAVVEAGVARTVSLAGLQFGEAIVERLDATRRGSSVRVELAWEPTSQVFDVLVRQTDD
ncbi:MAG: hypothetical protein ACYDAK_12205 [Candidatus Limnocylindrales bacterium]